MSPLCFVLAVLTVVFAVGCILFRSKNKAFEGMLCKFMASFGFISVAVVGYCTNPHDTYYFCFVCFALMFGFFGDVLLGIKEIAPTFKTKLVPLGTLYFLVGHVFYLIAFINKGGFNAVTLAIGVSGALVSFAVIKLMKMKVDKKLAPLLIFYYGMLIYKAASAALLAAESGDASSIVAFVGACLFVISDTCLGFLYFTPVKRKNIWVMVELSTYYPAQILLAMSVALM